MLNLKRPQAGDTLVEVALAMTILGAVIAGAYQLSNRALRIGHESKERLMAAQIQQYQAEALRNYRDNKLWAEFQAEMVGKLVVSVPEAPCEHPPLSTSRFSMQRSGTSLVTVANSNTATNPFTYCIIVTQVTASEVKFRSFVTWKSLGSDQTNKTESSTTLADVASLRELPSDE